MVIMAKNSNEKKQTINPDLASNVEGDLLVIRITIVVYRWYNC